MTLLTPKKKNAKRKAFWTYCFLTKKLSHPSEKLSPTPTNGCSYPPSFLHSTTLVVLHSSAILDKASAALNNALA